VPAGLGLYAVVCEKPILNKIPNQKVNLSLNSFQFEEQKPKMVISLPWRERQAITFVKAPASRSCYFCNARSVGPLKRLGLSLKEMLIREWENQKTA
jgi:hypothetical protein